MIQRRTDRFRGTQPTSLLQSLNCDFWASVHPSMPYCSECSWLVVWRTESQTVSTRPWIVAEQQTQRILQRTRKGKRQTTEHAEHVMLSNAKVCEFPSCKTSKAGNQPYDCNLMLHTVLNKVGFLTAEVVSTSTLQVYHIYGEDLTDRRTWLGFWYGCGESITEEGDGEIHGSFTVACRKGERKSHDILSYLPYRAII